MILGTLKQLFAGLHYLWICQETNSTISSKRLNDFIIPLVLGGFSSIFYVHFRAELIVFGSNGLISDFQGLSQLLLPFYVAALAAVATFEKSGLDRRVDGAQLYVNE